MIYHLFEACCDCVCLKKAWWKCPTGSPAHAWCNRWYSSDFLSLTPWGLNFKGRFWPVLGCSLHYHRKLKPGVRFPPLFFSSLKVWDDKAAGVSGGFRDYILNQLNTKTSFDYELSLRITEHPKVPHRSGQISLSWEIRHTAFVVKPPSRDKQSGDLDLGGIKPRFGLIFNHNRESKAIVCGLLGSFALSFVSSQDLFIEKEESFRGGLRLCCMWVG